jgi:hypothetical protein
MWFRLSVLGLLVFAPTAVAQDKETVSIDLAVTTPATSRFFSVPADKKFALKLSNVVPERTYKLVEEDRPQDVPKLTTNPVENCDKAADLLAAVLKGAGTELEVQKALADGAKFKDKAGNQCKDDPQIKTARALAPTLTFGDYTLAEGKVLRRTIKQGDTEWKIVVSTQGSQAAPSASDVDKLDRLRDVTDSHPSLIVMKCSYTAEKCATDSVFVNSDQVSTVIVTDVPKGKPLVVKVGAGEYFPCEEARFNFRRYTSSPDAIIIPLHMHRGWGGIFTSSMSSQQAEAGRRYGLDTCPSTGQPIESMAVTSAKTAPERATLEGTVRSEIAKLQGKTLSLDPRWNRVPTRRIIQSAPGLDEPEPDPEVPLFVRGRSEVLAVQFDFGGGDIKTVIVPIRYQRFWLDAGGFFVFSRHTDQSIQTETVSGSNPEKKRVTALNRQVSLDPNTGIVINVHPGNFPVLAVQFGIAANQGRLPSYFLGVGARARELGKRGLATIAVGVAMQQEDQFPLLQKGDELPADSARLQPTKKYGVTFPYISITLGFSFGGVSEKTDVRSSVTRSQ